MPVIDVLAEVTEKIAERSHDRRQRYLDRIDAAAANAPKRRQLGCANLAHGFAGCGVGDKAMLRSGDAPNLAIVTAYNDMLSAHQPFETLSRPHPRSGARNGRRRPGGGRCPGDVRWRHPG